MISLRPVLRCTAGQAGEQPQAPLDTFSGLKAYMNIKKSPQSLFKVLIVVQVNEQHWSTALLSPP